ncbi:MAG: hypothetical protein R2790_00800 [Flavobacterium haoranii]
MLSPKNIGQIFQKVDIIPTGYSIETPTVSADGKKLIFASNMPGGFGGFDLYEELQLMKMEQLAQQKT